MNRAILPILICFCLGCSDEKEPKPLDRGDLQQPVSSDVPPPDSNVSSMGSFTSYAHGLSGKAVVYTEANDSRTLRLENFTMTAGPDVYVFLSKSNNYSIANTIPLAMLSGSYANNNLELKLEDSIDLSSHRFVLVYCVQFNSLFGFSELN